MRGLSQINACHILVYLRFAIDISCCLFYIKSNKGMGEKMVSKEEQIKKIDKKLQKINSKKYSPWFYESYIEQKIFRLENERERLASLQKQGKSSQNQGREQ